MNDEVGVGKGKKKIGNYIVSEERYLREISRKLYVIHERSLIVSVVMNLKILKDSWIRFVLFIYMCRLDQ